MKKEEYLKQFNDYNKKLQTLASNMNKETRAFEEAQSRFRRASKKFKNDIQNARGDICSLYKKMFTDKEIYIKTGSGFYKPKNEDLNIPGYSFIPISNIEVENINNLNFNNHKPLVEYIEENAVNVEDNDSRELLKELNDETNSNGNYLLILCKKVYGQSYKEYNFEYGLARDVMPYLESNKNASKVQDILVKFFKKYKDLKEFLLKNFNDIKGQWYSPSAKYNINVHQHYFSTTDIDSVEKRLTNILGEFEVYKQEHGEST